MEAASIALLLSLKVAGWATAINLVAGIGTGYFFARTRFPGRDLLDTVLTLPMVLPPTVLGYYLLVLLGRNGVFGAWLQETFGINLIFTWQGASLLLPWWHSRWYSSRRAPPSKPWTASWNKPQGCWAFLKWGSFSG